MKKTLVLLGLALAVMLGFCGCGNEKSEETGIEIKKISEEEVYELFDRVEEKAKKIKDARHSMYRGFQKKWDLLKRKQAAADRAFSKNDYNSTSKFLQEAESAADWIMNQGLLRAEADEKKWSAECSRSAAKDPFLKVFDFSFSLYQQAVEYMQQGDAAYEKIEFEEAARLYSLAGNQFQQACKNAVPGCVKNMINSLVRIDAGTFKRGEQQVTISKAFLIGKYEVTQAQWLAVMGNNPASLKSADHPVEDVSWNDAMEFCKKLNDMGLAPAGYKFSLPTEAQWEYAARGGNKSKGYVFSGSNDIKEVAWYAGNSSRITHDVGDKKPNELGLYDMTGNVWEWCLDRYGDYGDEKEVTDPQGPADSPLRVLRGGGYSHDVRSCQMARRGYSFTVGRGDYIGFRLALVPVQ